MMKNPVGGARRPKVQKYSPREALTRLEVHQWMKEAELEGLRISEACGINIEAIRKDGYEHVVVVDRKGSKLDEITLPPVTLAAIHATVDGRTNGPVMLTSYGTRMNREAAGRIVARLCRKAGISQHITPHSLRHTSVTLLLDSGAGIRDVADFAGHIDIRTTSYYDRNRGRSRRFMPYQAMHYIGGADG